jgi:hypothetical protein
VSRPSKPSLRLAVAPVLGERDNRAQIERLRKALLGAQPRPLNPKAVAAVREMLAEDPNVSAAAVCRSKRLRRQDVLDALRALRTRGNGFPSARGCR